MPRAETVNVVVADGFRRELVRYAARDGDEVHAFLFIPERPAGGAVLALHQHNSQWELGKSEVAGLAGDSLQAFGPALARRGVTVLAPDALGFEQRVRAVTGGAALAPRLERPHSTADGWLQYYNQMAHRLVAGDLLMRKVVEDAADGLSVLGSLSGSPRLGVMGHSSGGTVTLFLAALDARVGFACASGAAGSLRGKVASGTGLDMALVIPGFLRRFDLVDVLRCVAPRRLLVVSSEGDPQTVDAVELVEEARTAFREQGCDDRLAHLRVPGAHALDQQRAAAMVDWMVTESGRTEGAPVV